MLPVSRRGWTGRIARLAAALVLAGGVLGLAGAGTAQAAACGPVSAPPLSPAGGNLNNTFNGVAAVSACNVWAVGAAGTQSLIEQWTGGGSWTVQPSPNPGDRGNSLLAASAVSASDIWAVGWFSTSSPAFSGGLAVHWNGTAWTRTALPDSVLTLTAVTAISATNVWATGADRSRKPLILHYDGTSWTSSQLPDFTPAGDAGMLFGLAATSASDVWAVGRHAPSGLVSQPLILHWNGTSWSQAVAPAAGTETVLVSVAADSAGDAWAVGMAGSGTEILHWDGHNWNALPGPLPAGSDRQLIVLRGVAAVSPTSAYAVGYYSTDGPVRTLVLHWDGTSLAQAPSPNPGGVVNNMLAVSAIAGGTAWAVGATSDQAGIALRTQAVEFGVVP